MQKPFVEPYRRPRGKHEIIPLPQRYYDAKTYHRKAHKCLVAFNEKMEVLEIYPWKPPAASLALRQKHKYLITASVYAPAIRILREEYNALKMRIDVDNFRL
jgi:hypothetical protein